MVCACIDIGSNTTRLLVAEVRAGRLREVLGRRAFTRIGRELRATGLVAPAKIEEVAAVVAEQREVARGAGAGTLRVVATAAMRLAANRDDLCDAVRERAGCEVDVLDGHEEARLAFLGATRTLPEAPPGTVAVVDVGGGSTEFAIGTVNRGVSWSASVGIGSGALADAHLRTDPPPEAELRAVREHAAAALEGLELPPADVAVAVGGSAASLRQVVGPHLDEEAAQRALELLAQAPARDVAERYGLAEDRVRLLPAGLMILAEAAGRLGRPLLIGNGGLREGVCLELAAGSPHGQP